MSLSFVAAFITMAASGGYAPMDLVLLIFASGGLVGLLLYAAQAASAKASARASVRSHVPVASSPPGTGSSVSKPALSSPLVAAGLLVALALAGALLEALFPPVSHTYLNIWRPSPAEVTDIGRRGLTYFDGTIDHRMLAIELGLMGGGLLAGLSPLFTSRGRALPPATSSALMYGRAATILHPGVVLLPLVTIGGDTVYGLMPPVFLILIPNVISYSRTAILAWMEVKEETFAKIHSPALPIGLALLWTAMVSLAMLGWDFGPPMGGSVLAMVALWLGSLSAWLHTTERGGSAKWER